MSQFRKIARTGIALGVFSSLFLFFRRNPKYGLKAEFLMRLFRFLWRLRFDAALAYIVAGMMVRNNRAALKEVGNRRVILAMDRNVFNDDIKNLKKFGAPYAFLSYPSSFRSIVTDAVWPAELQKQAAFYPRRGEYAAFFSHLSRVYKKALSVFERLTGKSISVILTCNMSYFQDYPWISAIQRCGKVFVTLHKESIVYGAIGERRLTGIYDNTDFRYEGDVVSFYNEFARGMYVRIGVVAREKTRVTGCPRVDGLVQMKKETSGEPFILIGAFRDASSGAQELWYDVMHAIHEDPFLRGRTVIKWKDLRNVALFAEEFPGVRAVVGPMEHWLAKNPVAFVSFNSTACLDALVAEVPLVVPWWKEALALGENAMLGPHTKEFHYIAYDGNALVKVLRDFLERRISAPVSSWRDNEALRAFIERKYSFLDGENSKRFFELVDSLVS